MPDLLCLFKLLKKKYNFTLSLREKKNILLLANLLFETDDVTNHIQYKNMSAVHSSPLTVNRKVNLTHKLLSFVLG